MRRFPKSSGVFSDYLNRLSPQMTSLWKRSIPSVAISSLFFQKYAVCEVKREIPANLHKGADPSLYEVDIEDMIEKSGCSKVYYTLEECLGEHDRDWSKCQAEVKALAECNRLKQLAAKSSSSAGGHVRSTSSKALNNQLATISSPLRVFDNYFTGLETAMEVANEVTERGACSVGALLSEEEILWWLGKARLLTINTDSNCLSKEIGKGRFHSSLLRSKKAEAIAVRTRVEASMLPRLTPVLDAFFGPGVLYTLSELQLLRTTPGCDAQQFHVDNAARGITLIVALSDVTQAHGPTRLLRGSHEAVFDAQGRYCIASDALYAGKNISTVDGVMPAGAGILFDARTLHRGLGNETHGACSDVYATSERPARAEDRLVLVLRWDRRGRRPPGVNPLTVGLMKLLGRRLERP